MKHKQDIRELRDPSEIIEEIYLLLEELVRASKMIRKSSPRLKYPAANSSSRVFLGPTGRIKHLIKERFFDEPKSLKDVVKRLRQEGFNYRQQVFSIALLRLVRNKSLLRLPVEDKRKGKEYWLYAERK
jgi:hypothetical protein